MNIKEIFERYKNKSLRYEFGELNLTDFGDISENILEEKYFVSSLSVKEILFQFENPNNTNYRYERDTYLYHLRDVFLKYNAWKEFELEDGFSKEDFEYENLRKCSKVEKTQRLLFCLRNYKKIIEKEKLNMLSYSASTLENKEDLDFDIESKKQGVQARYEIYKYLTENESKDQIPEIYQRFIEISSDPRILLEMLKYKNFDKFVQKKNKYYQDVYAKIKEEIPQSDLNKLLDFFKKVKKDFKFSFDSIICDFQTFSNYSNEIETIDYLENIYEAILEEEKQEEVKRQEELEKQKKEKEDAELRKKEEKTKRKNESQKREETKTKKKLDFDEGNIDEYLDFYKENPIPDTEKENVRILFLHWIFHNGERFESVLSAEKRKFLFDKIKKITEASGRKVSIFLCSDENEENSRKLYDSFNDNLRQFGVNNVILEGVTGEHGRFLIDSQGKKFRMYEMPEETKTRIEKAHKDAWEEIEEYREKDNQSFLLYTLPCSEKNGERIEDYVRAFRGCFRIHSKNLRYYSVGTNQMLVLTKNQFQDTVKNKLIRYCSEKYKFTEKDIINDLETKNEREVGDE